MIILLFPEEAPKSFSMLREVHPVPHPESTQRINLRLRAYGSFTPFALHGVDATLHLRQEAAIDGFLCLQPERDSTWYTYEFLPFVDSSLLTLIQFHGESQHSNVSRVWVRSGSTARMLRNRFYIPCLS